MSTMVTLQSNLRGLRDAIPILDRSIVRIRAGIPTLLDEGYIEVSKGMLIKMETTKEYSHMVLGGFTLIIAKDMQDTTGTHRIPFDKMVMMNRIVVELTAMCMVTTTGWERWISAIVDYIDNNPRVSVLSAIFSPALVALVGGMVGGAVGTIKLGTAVAGCCGTVASPTTAALATYVGGGALLGAGVGVLAVCIGYAVYRHYKSRDPNNEYTDLLCRIKSDLPNMDLGQIFSDMEAPMGPMRGCDHLDEEDRTCCICFQVMSPCPHPPGTTHDDLCAVLPFLCNHPICSECSLHSQVCVCPLCRAEKMYWI